ncbi:unnamed protein product [Prorocentrum cordatum]|uniref:Uncharacterized protein n=1 Tax=Prorocentrum cordatum TaxID=2364126 RepID=A0ABN9SN79_9DINO|nr:unnamed protein product [Polarella glacialis]
MIDSGHTCENMPETLSWAIRTGCANLSGWYTENRYCQLTCWEQGVPYTGDNCADGAIQSQNVCGYYQEKVSFESASAECERLGMHVCEQAVNGTECGHDGIDVWTPNTCTVSVEVREDGKVMFQLDSKTKQNPILVAWADGFPTLGNCSSPCSESSSGCICPIVVETRAVFAAVPSRSELLGNAARLRIGAFPQASADCLAPCDGEVKAYVVGGSGNVTESAVFECDGVYYKNAESVVEVAGHSFRNPPVFMLAKEITGRSVRTEEVFAEVEALMDHLYYHTNLPPFLAYRLIQRMASWGPLGPSCGPLAGLSGCFVVIFGGPMGLSCSFVAQTGNNLVQYPM